MSDEYPAQYLEGLRLFNAEDFFESHDVLEELWSECQDGHKKFYQGLIQAAVALFHFGNGNLGGAKKVYLSSRKYLEPYLPECGGLDLAKFLDDLAFCFQELIDDQQSCPVGIELQDDRIPKITIPGGND
jgi:predicted metal-dependent hydrolase